MYSGSMISVLREVQYSKNLQAADAGKKLVQADNQPKNIETIIALLSLNHTCMRLAALYFLGLLKCQKLALIGVGFQVSSQIPVPHLLFFPTPQCHPATCTRKFT